MTRRSGWCCAHPGVARVPLPRRAARRGDRGEAGLGLGARRPAQLFPLGLDARRRADAAGRRGPAQGPGRRWPRRRGGWSATSRARGLATEFACQWLEIRDFDTHDEKSERHFPTFAQVRPDLYEEAVRFFADLFARDGSVLELIDADYTFLNESLAKHYGIPGVTGPGWRRVRRRARRTAAAACWPWARSWRSSRARCAPARSCAATGCSRACWASGCPGRPRMCPQLPDDEAATDGLTVRQLVEKHRSNASCAGCHSRIDPFGFALEAYDPIGRFRQKPTWAVARWTPAPS